MIVPSTALILVALTCVAWIVLGASVSHLHHDTSTITSAVATAVILAFDFQMAAAHSGGAAWALGLAEVCVEAVVAVASFAERVGATTSALAARPELRAVRWRTTVPALFTANRSSTLCWSVVSSSGLVHSTLDTVPK